MQAVSRPAPPLIPQPVDVSGSSEGRFTAPSPKGCTWSTPWLPWNSAERKRIEAQGIQDFQKIVAQGLTQQVLRWKGIETTRLLAESPNSKLIIVGGRDGLPLILNTEPPQATPGK